MKDNTYFNRIQKTAEEKFVYPRIVEQSSTVGGGVNYVHKIEDISDNVTQWCSYNEDGRFFGVRLAIKNPLAGQMQPDMTEWVNNADIEEMVLIKGGDSSVAFEIETYTHNDSIGMKEIRYVYFADFDGSVEVNKISEDSGNWEVVGHTTVDSVMSAIDSSDFGKIVNCGFLDNNKQM